MYKKYKNTSLKYFIWFLIGVLTMELIGSYPSYVENFEFFSKLELFLEGTRFEKNNWFYTLFWKIGATLFFVYYFRSLVINPIFKKILKGLAVLFILNAVFTIVSNFDEFFIKSFSSINITSSFLIVIAVTFYLIQVLQSDKILSFYKSPNFYIAATILIWYLITTPLIFYDIYFSREDMPYVILKSAIMLFSNIFMYLTFTIALLCCKPKNI